MPPVFCDGAPVRGDCGLCGPVRIFFGTLGDGAATLGDDGDGGAILRAEGTRRGDSRGDAGRADISDIFRQAVSSVDTGASLAAAPREQRDP